MGKKLIVELVGDTSSLERAFGRASDQSSSFARTLNKASIVATGALAAVGGGAKVVIGAASDLNEQINKTGVVFGRNGDELVTWSRGLVQNFGVSQRAALEAAGTFGNMLVPMGFARDKAADMSKQMVQLAGDMSSFNNADPSEVLEALRSGLAGETEPLRKFGVFLSDARLKQEALTLGLYDGKGALDANAKASATMALILKDTKDAQGDFARTADSAANKTRIQAAETENLSARIGQGLLPAFRGAQTLLMSLTTVLGDHTTVAKIAGGIVAGLATAVLAVNAAMKVYTVATRAAAAATWLWTAALDANPVVLATVGVVALGVALVIAYKKSEAFRNVVSESFDAVKNAVALAVNAILGAIDIFLAGLQKLFTAASKIPLVGDKFKGIADQIGGARDAVEGLQRSIDGLRGKTVDVVTRNIVVKESFNHRALGGPVTAGTPYIVGERGEELFVPSQNGRIVPNSALATVRGSGGGDIVVPITLQVDGQTLFATVQKYAARDVLNGGSGVPGLTSSRRAP